MKNILGIVSWLILVVYPALAVAYGRTDDDAADIEDAPPLSVHNSVAQSTRKANEKFAEEISEVQLLEMNLRADIGFSGGRPVEQGFSLPSFRLGASGNLTYYLDYGFALGPTREFSSALLPQLLPVEAWVQFRHFGKASVKADPIIGWKIGMFTASLNPLWSGDLGGLPIPDYFEVHRAIFLSRDIGTELYLWPVPGTLRFTIGAFNGNGIVNLNTNSTRSLNAAVDVTVPIRRTELSFGVSGMGVRQAERTNVNFLENWVSDFFISLKCDSLGLFAAADVLYGRVEDSVNSASLTGATLTVLVRLVRNLRLMGRYEIARYSPLTSASFNHGQFGPVLELSKLVKIFLYYEHMDHGTGTGENSGQLLVRLTI